MRTKSSGKAKSHDLMVGQGENDHHRRGSSYVVIVNSLSIPPGAYEYRTALGASGFKTMRATLRGHQNIGNQGHCGVFALGSDVATESIGISCAYSSYTYMGCFSRLHGDSKLSQTIFGQGIYLKDAYIDGSDGVLEFFNMYPYNRNLKVYGTVMIK